MRRMFFFASLALGLLVALGASPLLAAPERVDLFPPILLDRLPPAPLITFQAHTARNASRPDGLPVATKAPTPYTGKDKGLVALNTVFEHK